VLRDVGFSYASAEGRAALRGVNLEAKPGEVVALVGPSGAGKSTIVNLVLRFYDAREGQVLLDGRDVRTLRLASLRAAIGLVPQEIFLFGGTIAENIRYGRPGATDADLRAAAEAAQAAGFIGKLPQGYDSVVGERGVRLSAGERQRIAIARVFLKDPAVVILDEATSALDAESEHLVTRALDRLMAGRTTLVVAHRLSTVRRADKVALVEAGTIVAEGPHAELFEKNALYRRLCELQMLPGTGGEA
jgi:ABC-type multidrug transport system fused ATPase/permease subunit